MDAIVAQSLAQDGPEGSKPCRDIHGFERDLLALAVVMQVLRFQM